MKRSRVLVVSLVVNVVLLAATLGVVTVYGWHRAAVKVHLSSDPAGPSRVQQYTDLGRERFAGLPGAATVVLGDSNVEYSPFGELLDGAALRGLGGANISEAELWLRYAVTAAARTVVVELGTNNVLQGATAEQDRAGYLHLIGKIRAANSRVRIVFLSVIPPAGRRAAAAAANRVLAQVCAAERVTLVDLGPLIAPSGELAARYSLPGGVHLNGAGYARIGPAIRAAVG